MPVRFRCPNDKCNTALSVAARKAGSVVTCPKCGQPVIVPTPPREPLPGIFLGSGPDDGSLPPGPVEADWREGPPPLPGPPPAPEELPPEGPSAFGFDGGGHAPPDDYPRRPALLTACRWLTVGLLAAALMGFFLPWVGMHVPLAEDKGLFRGKALLSQSGLQMTLGVGSFHPALEAAVEAEEKYLKEHAPELWKRRYGDAGPEHAAPWVGLYALLSGLALLFALASPDPRNSAKAVGLFAVLVLLLLAVQFGIAGAPLERAVLKETAREGGGGAAVVAAMFFETRYTFWFGACAAALAGVLAVQVAVRLYARSGYSRW